MNAYKRVTFVGYVLFIASLVLLVYGLKNLLDERQLDQDGLITTGWVFELEDIPPYQRAWVKFESSTGDTVRFLDKLFWNKYFFKYKIGQELEVIYDPKNPILSATINEYFQRNTGPWFPVVLGAIVALVGLIVIRVYRRKAKEFNIKMSRYK